MSETCFYHPEAPAQDACPECTMPICAACVASGGGERCGSCAAFYQDNDELHGHVPAAAPGADEFVQPMCTHHANLAADMQCLNCFRPFCLSCASTGYCPECAPQFVNRTNAAQQTGGHEVQHARTATEYVAPAMDMDFDLAGTYLSDEAPGPSAKPRPRKRPPGAAPGPKGAPAAKGGKKPVAKKRQPPTAAIAGAVVLVLALALGGYWFMGKGGSQAPAGPHKATITSPKAGTVAGVQMIKVKLTTPEDLDHLEIMIDGKAWGAKIKEAPFETDWPTSLAPNGKHKVEARAFYRDGGMVHDKQDYLVKNPNP